MTDDLVKRLLPCPFCKSTDIKSFSSVKDTGESMQVVQCWGCGAEMSRWSPYALGDEQEKQMVEAIAAWNNRATQSDGMATDLLDRLRATWCGRSGMEEKHLINMDGPEAADHIEAQAAEIERLREALQWMVDNDETNEGDEPMEEFGGQSWNEINAYWIDGLNRARAALGDT